MKQKLRLLVLIIVTAISSDSASAAPYCMGIRGNGELEPAHWGAMARTVEQLGIPSAMAGGSSATISMFLMESIATNPLVKNQPEQVQKERASLLIKSLLGFFDQVGQSKAWKDLMSFFGNIQKAKTGGILMKIGQALNVKNWILAGQTLQKGIDMGFVDPDFAKPLSGAIKARDLKKAKFYVQQMGETLAVLGKFDAANDNNLFFRTGLVNFERLAHTFGRVAGFYAAQSNNSKLAGKWQAFVNSCAAFSVGKTWVELVSKRPICRTQFADAFNEHFANESPTNPMENRVSGFAMPVFASTTIMTGKAAEEAIAGIQKYHQLGDKKFGEKFTISNSDEIRFGYWGSTANLKKIASNLDKNDEKGRRFFALGPAKWKTVLKYSPAEPGLAPLKPMSKNIVSAGGWSDLHPVQVLRAYGCPEVVLITRLGGESLFAQGVAKRVMNFSRPWNLFDATTAGIAERNIELNNSGDPSDKSSLWARLYNLGNESSSFSRALRTASAVMCTNWNKFDVKKDMVGLIEDSYKAPYYVSEKTALQLGPVFTDHRPGCSPN